jgi:DNA repair exonuclease SbcCD nuclease subunit
MRLLHFADLHLDSPFTWAGPEVGRARRRALRQVLQRICALAAQEQVDALVCAGDLYENERLTPDTAHFVAECFNDVEVPVLLAPGNHDWLGAQSLYATADWAPNVHVFTSAQLQAFELTQGFTFWGAAHQAPAKTPGMLEHFRVDRGGVNVAVFHGSEQGAFRWQDSGKVPHAAFDASQIPQAGLDHALLGHFHSPRHDPLYTYPGNPDPLTFGEQGTRGAVLVTVGQDGTVTQQTMDVSVSTLTDLRVDVTGAQHSHQIQELARSALADLTGIVRLTLHGDVAEDVDVRLDDIRALGRHLEAFVPRLGDLTVAYDLDDLEREQTVRGQFVRMVRSDPALDDDTRHRVLVTGLRALAGRTDLEVM